MNLIRCSITHMAHGTIYLLFSSLFYFPFDFTSQLNVRVLTRVTVYITVLFLLEWWATERRDLPQEIESISFHTDMFTSILTIPLRAAEVVNRGEMKKGTQAFTRVKTTWKLHLWPQSKTGNKIALISWESYFPTVLYFNAPILSLPSISPSSTWCWIIQLLEE